jgi:Uma2 family endonuclease
VQFAPEHKSSTVNLDRYQPPDLVIEIADSSLSDDLERKQILYQSLGTTEYWVVDVKNIRIVAFAISENSSTEITESQVLPGLAIGILLEALQRSRQTDLSQVGAWLLNQFQSI